MRGSLGPSIDFRVRRAAVLVSVHFFEQPECMRIAVPFHVVGEQLVQQPSDLPARLGAPANRRRGSRAMAAPGRPLGGYGLSGVRLQVVRHDRAGRDDREEGRKRPRERPGRAPERLSAAPRVKFFPGCATFQGVQPCTLACRLLSLPPP